MTSSLKKKTTSATQAPQHEKVFIINLAHNTWKRALMEKELSAQDITSYEFIPGVYGKDLSDKYISQIYNRELMDSLFSRELAKSELGCSLSHFACYQRIIDENLNGAYIFEDDSILLPNTKSLLEEIPHHTSSSEARLILLTKIKSVKRFKTHQKLLKGYRLKEYHKGLTANAYYVTQQTAQNLLQLRAQKGIFSPNDVWDVLMVHANISISVLTPHCVSPIKDAREYSDIESGRQKVFAESRRRRAKENQSLQQLPQKGIFRLRSLLSQLIKYFKRVVYHLCSRVLYTSN